MPPNYSATMNDQPPAKRAKLSTMQLLEARHNLPIFPVKQRIIDEIRQCESVIVIGETGSGKSTQIPQFLDEFGLHKNRTIACTQPRRVAAITVAQRVANEMGSEIGETVGYCVRFDDTSSSDTRIRYMTDGMLLREAILDPLLRRYSIVILDEAHERTVQTDVLFGVVKRAQFDRRTKSIMPLKVIIMSATMDVDHFSNYFNKAKVIYLEGRQFPIKILYAKKSQSDYFYSALITVFQIHKQAPMGEDILIFMTGQDEIEALVKNIRDVAHDLPSQYVKVTVYALYANMTPHQQLKVFEPAPAGSRKIIVSTNVAETSITIHGVAHVIDSGRVKAKTFDAISGLDQLKVVKVSQAQAWQRSGRAGREAPGTCYRLYTEAEFQKFSVNTVPELQRCNLASVVLQLLAMGIPDIGKFDFLDKPSPESIKAAIEQLVLLDAVENTPDRRKLTPLGKKMAAFPLDPSLSRIILKSTELQCSEEILTIVALLSVETILTSATNKEKAAAAREKFISAEGDHITALTIFRAYNSVKGNRDWCYENFINSRNVKLAIEVRSQLREIFLKQGWTLDSCGRDLTNARKCLVYGFFMNAAELVKEGDFRTVNGHKTVSIHPSSALFRAKPSCVIYTELVKTTKCYMKSLCTIDPQWLLEAAPAYFKQKLSSTKT